VTPLSELWGEPVPRKQQQRRRRAEAPRREAEAYRGTIDAIVGSRSDYAFKRLTNRQRMQLVDDLVDALGFAMAGLPPAVRGGRAMQAAWNLDIFVRDVCDALRRARVPVAMNADPSQSHAQLLARDIAVAAGLPGHGKRIGNLFKQMQRGRQIKKKSHPDASIRVRWEGSHPEDRYTIGKLQQ
jgi:hypothetical protein